MAHSKIGFITSGGGGNPTGIGAYVNALHTAGIPAVVMCNDGMVGIADALATGGNHVLLYRIVKDNTEQWSVPDYSLSPAAAAQKHWDKLRPEFHPGFVAGRPKIWLQPINEVDKNRASWLGDFGVEFARIANGQGYKVAMFAFSSGEPEPGHWRTAGMLNYLRYCAANKEMAAVALHEYDYGHVGMQNTYPWHVGRFQELFRACDENGIGRPYVLITEFGWSYTNVPSQEQVMADVDYAGALYAQYREVLGAAIWYLGPGFDGIANRVQPLIAPVTSHALTTTYPDPEPPGETTMQIKSFEDGWADLSNRLQQPNGFTLQVIASGAPLWYPGGNGKATGTVEAKHLECGKTLPAHQCEDGSDPLALDGPTTFKIQAVAMATGTSLKYAFTETGRQKVTVPVNVHWQQDSPNETNDVYAVLLLNGVEVKRLQHPELKDRTWHYMSGEADGPVTAELRYQTSWANSRDCFTDKWTCEDLEEQSPMTWQEQVAEIAKGKWVLAFLPGASLQTVPASHGFQVGTNEIDYTRPDGVAIRFRAAIHPTTGEQRIYWCVIPNWLDVQWFTVSGGTPPQSPF